MNVTKRIEYLIFISMKLIALGYEEPTTWFWLQFFKMNWHKLVDFDCNSFFLLEFIHCEKSKCPFWPGIWHKYGMAPPSLAHVHWLFCFIQLNCSNMISLLKQHRLRLNSNHDDISLFLPRGDTTKTVFARILSLSLQNWNKKFNANCLNKIITLNKNHTVDFVLLSMQPLQLFPGLVL